MAKRTSKIGFRRMRGNWTPKRAHAFCMSRIGEIELILQEIASTYADVDQIVIYECDSIRDCILPALVRTLSEALEEGRTL